LDLVGVREVRLDKGGTVSVGDYIFSEKKNKNLQFLTETFGEYCRE